MAERTCLSVDDHEEKTSNAAQHPITNYLSHFMGCLEFWERKEYFSPEKLENSLWQRQTEITATGNGFHNQPQDSEEVKDRVAKKLYRELDSCINELARIEKLRAAMKADVDRPGVQTLFDKVDSSRLRWKKCQEYVDGLPKVREWRESRHRESCPMCRSDDQECHNVNGQMTPTVEDLQTVLGKLQKQFRRYPQPVIDKLQQPFDLRPSRTVTYQTPYNPEQDLNVYVMQWIRDKGKPLFGFDNEVLGNKFPNQRTSVADMFNPNPTMRQMLDPSPTLRILGRWQRPLDSDRDTRGLRYLHFPATNMEWVEKAMATYYDEPDKQFRHRAHRDQVDCDSKAHTILRPQYWRGQEHGDRGTPVHGRHLRPMCEVIAEDPNKLDDARNLVMFMPYLHWETDRKRNEFAAWMDTVTEDFEKKKEMELDERKKLRQRDREGMNPKPAWMKTHNPPEASKKAETEWTFAFDGLELHRRERLKLEKCTGLRDRLNSENKLGQYLIDAARLYEEMSDYRDKHFIKKFLHHEPPLHPRRTLDQAHYWSLSTTGSRDRDQVVYRATKAPAGEFHVYDAENDSWRLQARTLDSHQDGCNHCRERICKVSRLVMVDQLWMWILDSETVLTFFPKRYGTNKPDVSGVHKSIRNRIKLMRPNQIRTAFDLGLVIIEECSNTFFDRTKTPDPRQPLVMDQFAEAIANVANQHKEMSERLWMWTEHAKLCYTTDKKAKPSLLVALLDINAEGKLQREIRDITEELDIMFSITRTQQEMVQKYIINVEKIVYPDGVKIERSETRRVNGGVGTENKGSAGRSFSPDTSATSGSQDTRSLSTRTQGPPTVKPQDYKWFKRTAEALVNTIEKHLAELKKLQASAKTTEDCIKDLLDLKQQQASVLQAWHATQETKETINQGRSIMVFTVITLIFAPLSFMTSLFSMQNELSGSMMWGTQLKYIFAISLSIAGFSIMLAFNRSIRLIFPFNWAVYSPIHWVFWFLLVQLPAPKVSFYKIWLQIKEKGQELTSMAAGSADHMKAEIMANERKRQQGKRKAQRENKEMNKKKEMKKTQSQRSQEEADGARKGLFFPGDFIDRVKNTLRRRGRERAMSPGEVELGPAPLSGPVQNGNGNGNLANGMGK